MTKAKAKAPDALPLSFEAQRIKDYLAEVQAKRLNVELAQVINDDADTDVIPGESPVQKNGEIQYEDGQPVFPTYGEHYATYDGQIARLVTRAQQRPGVLALVNKLIAADTAAAEAEAALADADAGEIEDLMEPS